MPVARSLTRRGAITAVLGAAAFSVYRLSRGSGEPLAAGAPISAPVAADRLASPSGGSSASTGSPSGAAPSGTTPSPSGTTTVTASGGADVPPGGLELPRGGRTVLPRYRLLGFCGGPGSAAFGRLGVGDIDARVREIERLGAAYSAGRTVLPVLELVTVVAQRFPGPDGMYRVRVGPDVVRSYLDAARRHRALLLLNVQPGRARFLDEVRALEPWLREPDVGLALDPEWAVGRGQVPGRVFGSTTGAEIDGVSAYVAGLVAAGGLPEKVLVVHQLAPQIIRNLRALRPRPGVVVIKSVDGIGPPAAKVDTWKRLVADLPSGVRPGFKLFFEEDTSGGSRLMTAGQVLSLRPAPDYVMYE